MMLGAIGSQNETMMNFTIPRNLDLLPNSLREKLPAKTTDSAEWHLANFPKPQVNSVKKKAECFQSYIDTQSQVQTYAGPKGMSTQQNKKGILRT